MLLEHQLSKPHLYGRHLPILRPPCLRKPQSHGEDTPKLSSRRLRPAFESSLLSWRSLQPPAMSLFLAEATDMAERRQAILNVPYSDSWNTWWLFHKTKFWGGFSCGTNNANSPDKLQASISMRIYWYICYPLFPFKPNRSREASCYILCFQTRNRFKNALLTGLRTSGKVSQRGNTMGRTIRNVTCLRRLEGQPRLRGWSSSSSPVSVVCCGERGKHTALN